MAISVLDDFAREHHGIVTREAAHRAGVSTRTWYRLIERGLLELVHPGVARMYGSIPTSVQTLLAAVLAAGPGALASHRSAAWLWGVPGRAPANVDIVLPDRRRQATVAGATVHRPRDLLDLNPSRRLRVPCTNILRTLCDLGAVEPGAVSGAVGHVVTSGLASPAALHAAIGRHRRPGRAGLSTLHAALEEWVLEGKPVDSILEPAMHDLLRRYGLPGAEFHPQIGGYEPDFVITGSPLILECDGWTTHGLDRAQFERDRARDADLAALGYITLRFTYRGIVKRPGREAERIRRNIARWAPHLLAA